MPQLRRNCFDLFMKPPPIRHGAPLLGARRIPRTLESIMQIIVRLAAETEAERLKTALYRFREIEGAVGGPEPAIRLEAGPDGLVSVVDFGGQGAAEAFHLFWARFRTETFGMRGLGEF